MYFFCDLQDKNAYKKNWDEAFSVFIFKMNKFWERRY